MHQPVPNPLIRLSLQAALAITSLCSEPAPAAGDRPNVILVMTDDQGYGDLGCHGNPILKTPEIDKLHSESIRFTDFHVSPFCTPTRASLMTGHHAGRSGAIRTAGGRSMLHTDERTVANLFADGGYVTGMAGKWHLGDNAPHRPQDRGFQDVVWHRCGGIGQASDYWGNDYFDDTYERVKPGSQIGAFEPFQGYCTDVFFAECGRFIEENRERPFFFYLSLNAPHGPYRVGAEWAAPYKDNRQVANPNFYGMIANIDHNVGVLRQRLTDLGLADNTILIFMTDNGTAAGAKFKGLDSEAITGFNAGMRGKKSSIYEGGQRVPFFIYWPDGDLTGGRDIDTLAAHIDVLPTLAELCGMPIPESYDPDGLSLVPLLSPAGEPWPRDHLVIQFHGGAGAGSPLDLPFKDSVVLTERWRLVNSGQQELYDIQGDPAQRRDVSAEYPEVVTRLRALYNPFWQLVSPRLSPPARIDLGHPTQNPTELCSQDWFMASGNPPWHFGAIKKLPRVTAPWLVDVREAGRYRITLRQWPAVADKPVVAMRAKVKIAGEVREQAVEEGSKGVVFELDLPRGPSELETYLFDEAGRAGGAYFTEVELLRE
ncbi:MAG: arylsulfatase [Verrucomicrobiales bacterium]